LAATRPRPGKESDRVRIVDVRATPVYVPMIRPLRGSIGVETGMTRVIVELVTDEGLVGLGESNGGAQLAEAILEARPLFIGLDPIEVGRITKRFSYYRITSEQMARAANYKMAGAGIEMACWDLVGKILGKRCGELWGGLDKEEVEFAAYVFYRYESLEQEGNLSDPQYVAEYTMELCKNHGFRDVKLKTGVLNPGTRSTPSGESESWARGGSGTCASTRTRPGRSRPASGYSGHLTSATSSSARTRRGGSRG
jgi:glucarate dehydratase